jgi:hypothetical protein
LPKYVFAYWFQREGLLAATLELEGGTLFAHGNIEAWVLGTGVIADIAVQLGDGGGKAGGQEFGFKGYVGLPVGQGPSRMENELVAAHHSRKINFLHVVRRLVVLGVFAARVEDNGHVMLGEAAVVSATTLLCRLCTAVPGSGGATYTRLPPAPGVRSPHPPKTKR